MQNFYAHHSVVGRVMRSSMKLGKKDNGIRISGSKAVLARAASSDLDKAAQAVLSIVQEWRAGQDESANTYVIEVAI